MAAKTETMLAFWLSDRRVIIVESQVSQKCVVVVKSVQAELPLGIFEKGSLLEFDKLRTFLDALVRKMKPSTNFANINLPAGNYIVKQMQLDENYINSSPELITWEMRHHLAAPEQNYYFSHFRLTNRSYILAANKNATDQRIELLKSIGFIPVAVEPSCVILYNFLAFVEQDLSSLSNVAFLELSTPYSTLSLYSNGLFFPGGGFLTEADVYSSAYSSNLNPSLEKYSQDLRQFYEMLFLNPLFQGKKRQLDLLVLSGGNPNSQVALEAEKFFNSSIYLSGGIKKIKTIKLKGNLKKANIIELNSAIGLSLHLPSD
jgi:hypothetical protein